jgi:polysaccharide pyruvyl transferase WcaK-like protein
MTQFRLQYSSDKAAKPSDVSFCAIEESTNQLEKTRKKPQKICLFGMFGGGNFGNDASLESFLLFLREARPEAEISCVCVDPEAIGRAHKISTMRISAPGFSNAFMKSANVLSFKLISRLANWQRAIKYLRNFDIVIVPGTSTLCDYGSSPFGTPYGLFRWAAAARICGVKFCFVGTGAGPIPHPVSRWMCKSAAAWAYYRSFRDRVSKDFITSLGLDTSRDQIYPDLVFKLPTPELCRLKSEQLMTIGVGLMRYDGWRPGRDPTIYQTYIEKMGHFITSLLERGHRVRLLTGETVDRRAVIDASRIATTNGYELIEDSRCPPEPRQLIAEPTTSLHDVMRQIADTDLVVATRFHNVVCALKLARPTISIGYEAKNDAVMNECGLGDFCQFIEDLDLELLEIQLAKLLKGREEYIQIVERNLESIKGKLGRHEQELLSKVL